MLSLSNMVNKITNDLQQSLVEGAALYEKTDGHVYACKVVKVLDEGEGDVRYEVAWFGDVKININKVVGEHDLIHKKFPFGREVLKSYIRKSTYRSLPWVLHNSLASKYGIPTEPPEDLKCKISFLHGCVVTNKKRKDNANNNIRKNKRKQEGSDGTATDNGVANGDESMRYPIDAMLVKPCDDDPVLTDRPSPLEDFSIPMDYVGDLLTVFWISIHLLADLKILRKQCVTKTAILLFW